MCFQKENKKKNHSKIFFYFRNSKSRIDKIYSKNILKKSNLKVILKGVKAFSKKWVQEDVCWGEERNTHSLDLCLEKAQNLAIFFFGPAKECENHKKPLGYDSNLAIASCTK